MTVTERRNGPVTILDLGGQFTLEHGVAEFRDIIRTLLERGQTQILLNYDIAYMDKAGLHELAKASLTVKNHGGTVKMVNLTKRIGPGLHVIGALLAVFENYDDEAKALASFQGNQS
jgi:anti-anti-sigma factor